MSCPGPCSAREIFGGVWVVSNCLSRVRPLLPFRDDQIPEFIKGPIIPRLLFDGGPVTGVGASIHNQHISTVTTLPQLSTLSLSRLQSHFPHQSGSLIHTCTVAKGSALSSPTWFTYSSHPVPMVIYPDILVVWLCAHDH